MSRAGGGLCRNWAREGACRFGDGCRFSHATSSAGGHLRGGVGGGKDEMRGGEKGWWRGGSGGWRGDPRGVAVRRPLVNDAPAAPVVEARPRFYLGGARECAAELEVLEGAVARLMQDAKAAGASEAAAAAVLAERWLNLVIRYRVARQSLQSNRAPLADRVRAAEASAGVSLRAGQPAEFKVCVKLLTRELLPMDDPAFRTPRAVEWAGYEVLLAVCHTRDAFELHECLEHFARRKRGALPSVAVGNGDEEEERGEDGSLLGVLAFEMKVVAAVRGGNAPAFKALLQEAGADGAPPLRASVMRLATPHLVARGYGAAMRAYHMLPLDTLAKVFLPFLPSDYCTGDDETVALACAELGVDPPHRVAQGHVFFKEPPNAAPSRSPPPRPTPA